MEVVVVGCGLTGTVVARQLAEQGHHVRIVDRREHIGGNMYDYVDEYGILVHRYGPHTFHTKKRELFEYMTRYGQWVPYKLTCGAVIDNKYTPTPFNFTAIDTFYSAEDAADIKERIKKCFPDKSTAAVVEVLSCEDSKVRAYAEFLFEKDYSLYTAKQWGVPASTIDPSVLKRVPLRFSYDEGYFDDDYEVMPKTSYVDFFKNLLDHRNITVELGVDARDYVDVSKPLDKIVVYTGAIDELFAYEFGRLPYRSLHFEWHHEDIESKQPAPVVAYPQAPGFTRITEYNKLPVQTGHGSSYAVEYSLPYQEGKTNEPYYPVLTEESQQMYSKYLERAKQIKNLYVCGRLGDFKYYNMDQALERALLVADEISRSLGYE